MGYFITVERNVNIYAEDRVLKMASLFCSYMDGQ